MFTYLEIQRVLERSRKLGSEELGAEQVKDWSQKTISM